MYKTKNYPSVAAIIKFSEINFAPINYVSAE